MARKLPRIVRNPRVDFVGKADDYLAISRWSRPFATRNREAQMTELEYWTQQIKKGRISRREFMGRAAALGVSTPRATTMVGEVGVAQPPKRGRPAQFRWPYATAR